MDENAVICRGCDFILDTEFLGDGILDEEHSLRPGAGGVDAAAFNLADAVILGNIDDDSQSFETSDSGFHLNQHLSARLYVSGRSQALMSPDAVPAATQPVEGLRLTPFERHVLAFIDGKRPVEVIRKAAGLDEAEVKTALATLADKGLVKVVGRALSDADFDAETAPKSPFRRARVRGSIVGAVALVGDEADQAIEEAFRTQVSLSPLRRPRPEVEARAGDREVHPPIHIDDDDAGAPTGQAKGLPGSLPSDADPFLDLKGTDEVERAPAALRGAPAARGAPAPLRGAPKAAVNQLAKKPPDSGSFESADASLLDDSDGFDEFSEPSEIATAVARPQSASDSVAPPAPVRAPRQAGVFAELSESGAPLAGLDELADSRLQLRPDVKPPMQKPPAQPRAQPRPALVDPPKRARVPGHNSQEIEREAASGEVWDESPGKKPPVPAPRDSKQEGTNGSSLSDLLSDPNDDEPTANVSPEAARALLRRSEASGSFSFEEPTAAGQPMPPQALPRVGRLPGQPPREDQTGRVKIKKQASAMASMPDEQVLPDADVDEHSGLLAHRGRGAADDIFGAEDGGEDGDELPPEHTAHRPDMLGSLAEDSIDASEEHDPVPVPARPPRAAQERAQLADAESEPSHSGAGLNADLESQAVDTADLPGIVMDKRDASADAADLFASDSLSGSVEASEDASAAGSDDESSQALASSAAGDHAEDDVDEDPASAFASAAGRTAALERDSADSTNDIPAKVVRAAAPPAPLLSTHASSLPSGEETEWPLEDPDASERDDSQASERDPSEVSAAPSLDEPAPPPRRGPPPPPAPRSRPVVATNRRAPAPAQDSSSSELVDSALLIRPAAKAVPLFAAVAAAKGSRPRERQAPERAAPDARARRAPPPPEPSSELSADSSEVEPSSEATINVDRDDVRALRGDLNRGGQVGVGKQGRGAAAIPSGLSEAMGRPETKDAHKPKPTDEMRRKGRQLFEEAQKEFAAGRMGAARMNARLASIYDPDSPQYAAALAAWEDGGAAAKPVAPTAAQAPAENSGLSESEDSQREKRSLYDEAQDFENQGDFDEALEVLYRGVDRYPNAAAFHNRIGVLLAMKKRDFDGAISSIQRAIDLEPDNLHYRNNLGKVMQRVRPRA